MDKSKELLESERFKKMHRKNEKDFTRERKLPFSRLMVFMIRKSIKSIQNRLNEFVKDLLTNFTTVTSGAYTKARKKLNYTAFIELNKQAVVETLYEDEDYRKYKGFRLCAIDGSKVRLPNEKEIEEHFGTIRYKNKNISVEGSHAFATVSVLYDLLNEIAIDSEIGHCKKDEELFAYKHFQHANENDLILFDRGYCSYTLLAHLCKKGINFVVRCPVNSFYQANKMFKQKIESCITTIEPPDDKKKLVNDQSLPSKISVRFVRVMLDTGDVEVLVSSLVDEQLYPTDDFKELYWFRWGIETFFDRIKNRLDLENFTGKTTLSVQQDFYATIYISGLESILIEDAQDILDQKTSSNKYPQQVNKSVSFNTIKNYALDLLFENDSDLLFEKLTQLFLSSPTCIRKDRPRPRVKSPRKQVNYYKRKRKPTY
ncbi:IS4 family transposase [Candidatus Uabimicrobium amorphum]|uniref:IS4 family transposase n=1 Tax=Uabimicrobium amorphum TaxID=2596890 RepID=UPI0021BC9DB7|nr:IS4 family transposase [Candidatus Uabimicrobium amorphum]